MNGIKQAREIRHFLYSQYFADGLRITLGAVLPAIIGYYLGDLSIGITISLGALMTSIADSPGLVSHRRNAMLITVGLIFINTLLTKLISPYPMWVTIEILLTAFVYAMLAVFGPRSAAIGTAAMLMVVLHLHQLPSEESPLHHSIYITLGALWYTGFSLGLSQFMPYRLAQQELAEGIHEVAVFLKIKSTFYDVNVDNDEAFKKIIEQQVSINEHQSKLRELLFKSKVIVRDTTKIGRTLILVFSDINDLFEQSMATHYDYNEIQGRFGHTPVFKQMKSVIFKLSDELENLSYSITVNQPPRPRYNFQSDLETLKRMIDEMEKTEGENVFVLKKILINVRNIVNRINGIFGYFVNPELKETDTSDFTKFVPTQTFGFKLLRDNLTLRSTTFRHALRLAIVMALGYILSQQFEFGDHSYWILLTILVILKPGFSLTKQRNFQRLTGTIIGGGIGVLFLILVGEQTARFSFMLIMMICAYSMLRKNYIIGVIFMTPYLLVMYSFLGIDTMLVAQERIIDTIIGGVLAFSSSYFIFPNWESKDLKGYMDKLLIANYQYLAKALNIIDRNIEWDITEYKLARKEVFVHTANLASAFQRMITEPKGKQTNAGELNRFIVYNHLFSSYSANFFEQVRQSTKAEQLAGEPVKLIKQTLKQLQKTIESSGSDPENFRPVSMARDELLMIDTPMTQEKQLIVEQLNFLKKISTNMSKSYATLIGIGTGE